MVASLKILKYPEITFCLKVSSIVGESHWSGFEGPEPREREALEAYQIEMPEPDLEIHESLQKQEG